MESLKHFSNDLRDISGVLSVDTVNMDGESTVQVKWTGEPHDYLTRVSDARTAVDDDLVQVRPTAEFPARTADGMPIHYYQLR